MSDTITRGVHVQVESTYMPAESSPEDNHYLFTYHISISNRGSQTVQLLSRHWIITDAEGKSEEVRGPGVVGAQPVLKPGESFSYSSFCPLSTPVGTMQGTYQMVLTESQDKFDATIAPFSLAVPSMLN